MFKTEYDNVIVISFGCEDDFRDVEMIAKRHPKLHHIVLTEDPTSEALADLKRKYSGLAHEVLSLNDVRKIGIDSASALNLSCLLTEETKIYVRGHGAPRANNIASRSDEKILMKELALLLKHSTNAKNLRIVLHSCFGAKGNVINSIEGSTAQQLFNELKKLGFYPTISASTAITTISNEHISASLRVSDSTFDGSDYFTDEQNRNALTEIINEIPEASRKNIADLAIYDRFFFDRPVGKAIGSKVIISEEAGELDIEYPYGRFDTQAIISAKDQREKYLYAYSEISAAFRDEAREICLGYLAEIATDYPEIQNYEGFQRLKNSVRYHPYPYPAYLSSRINSCVEQTNKIIFSSNNTWDTEPHVKSDPKEHEQRKIILSEALNKFKTNINSNQRLNQIPVEHLAFAEEMYNAYKPLVQKKASDQGKSTELRKEAKEEKVDSIRSFAMVGGILSIGASGVLLSLGLAPIVVPVMIALAASAGMGYFFAKGVLKARDYIKTRNNIDRLEKEPLLNAKDKEDSTRDMLKQMQSSRVVKSSIDTVEAQTKTTVKPADEKTTSVVGNLVRRSLFQKVQKQPSSSASIMPEAQMLKSLHR